MEIKRFKYKGILR